MEANLIFLLAWTPTMVVVTILGFCYWVGLTAKEAGYSKWGFTALSMAISPVLAWVALQILDRIQVNIR